MDLNKKLLDIYLAEHKFINDQMHTRMNVVSRLITISASFFALLLVNFFFSLEERLPIDFAWAWALGVIPFWVLAMLIAREDFLMLSHDRYYMLILRKGILEVSGANEIIRANDESHAHNGQIRALMPEILTFLNSMSGSKFGPIINFTSVFRYAFSIFGMSIIGFVALFRIYAESTPNSAKLIFPFMLSSIALIVTGFVLFFIYLNAKNIYKIDR